MRLGNSNPKTELRANRRQQATAGLPQLDLAIGESNFTSPEGLTYYRKRETERLRRERAAERKALRESGPRLDSMELHCCSVAELRAKVPSASVDAVITDPPYAKASLPVYADLAEFAAHALVPGGVLVVMTGTTYLRETLNTLCEHPALVYRWTAAWTTEGNTWKCFNARAWQKWKPILILHKEPREAAKEVWFIDKIENRRRHDQGQHHKWGQSLPGFQQIVERFAWPGQTICDPFLGGGTTALAALERGCAFIGCDIDASCIETTEKRIEKVRREYANRRSNGGACISNRTRAYCEESEGCG